MAIVLEEALQELFYDLHHSHLFDDGKVISDAVLKRPADEILAAYRSQKDQEDFDLWQFFQQYFAPAKELQSNYVTEEGISIAEHIELLWDELTRRPTADNTLSSRIELPYPYIVPGGRFNEVYYWDSYFTMLGLQRSGRTDMIRHMIDNFAHLLEVYGLIPNGNRTYYLGRSQPPFFACMVELLATSEGDSAYVRYLPAMEREYAFWMSGAVDLVAGQTSRRVVHHKGHIVSRYYDDILQPRTEMYSDDIQLVEEVGQQLVTDIRAACESGWDFSSRWLKENLELSTIHTTEIVPVDLNALLYNLESIMKRCYERKGDHQQAEEMRLAAESRATYIRQQLWDENEGYFADLHLPSDSSTGVLSLATVYPLYFGIASAEQADAVAVRLKEDLLRDGGLVTTAVESGQQWDSPNGWAPLQWLAYKSLQKYGHDDLAEEVKERWCRLIERVFEDTGKLMEKYNVVDVSLTSGGGEYPVQDGFGWTNGVYLALRAE